VTTAFRRHFHRPSEIVIGYDEQVVGAGALQAARDAWGGDTVVRTMPFNRAEPDPTNALMIALGEIGAGGLRAPSRSACESIASALAMATPAPWRAGIRFDRDSVIVRGSVVARTVESLAGSLLALPALFAATLPIIGRWRDEGLHLITARWDDQFDRRWAMGAAHGFKGDKWMQTLDSGAGPDA
jgi:hypothetical protein